MAASPEYIRKSLTLPDSLKEELALLREWQASNAKEAHWDKVNFWALKLTAIVSSASSGFLGYFGWDKMNLILGVIAAICVAVDGLRPRGMLYKVHHQSSYDIRQLQELLETKWQTGCLRNEKQEDLIASILEEVFAEKKRIINYLRDIESALGSGVS